MLVNLWRNFYLVIMAQIKITFEVTDDFINHCKRIQKEYGMTPQHFAEEAIYEYQTEDWNNIISMTVDSPLQDGPIRYKPKKK